MTLQALLIGRTKALKDNAPVFRCIHISTKTQYQPYAKGGYLRSETDRGLDLSDETKRLLAVGKLVIRDLNNHAIAQTPQAVAKDAAEARGNDDRQSDPGEQSNAHKAHQK
jgi:hypothetical protein